MNPLLDWLFEIADLVITWWRRRRRNRWQYPWEEGLREAHVAR